MYVRKGTPTNEVTIPIGTIIPGITDFDMIDAQDINRTPNMEAIGTR